MRADRVVDDMGLGAWPTVQVEGDRTYKSQIRYEMTSNAINNYFTCLPSAFAYVLEQGLGLGNLTIDIKMIMNVLCPSSSILRIYKTGKITDRKVWICKMSLLNIIYNSKEEKSIGNSQMSDSRDRLRKSWKIHSGILCSGEIEWGGLGFLTTLPLFFTTLLGEKTESIYLPLLLNVYVVLIIHKEITAAAAGRKVWQPEMRLLLFYIFLIMDHVNVQSQNYYFLIIL